MSVLSYQSIRNRGILTPFYERTTHEATGLTFGCGSASYDVRLAQTVVVPQHKMVLASTFEQFNMPNDVCANVCDKSSLIRTGLSVHNTFIDPGWRGFLTLEIEFKQLLSDEPQPEELVLQALTPIAQIVFKTLDEPSDQPYEGRYQNQQNKPIPAIVKL